MSSLPDAEKQPLLSTSTNSPQNEEEPTLSHLQAEVFRAQRAYMRAWSRTTSGKWHRRLMILITSFLVLCMLFCLAIILQEDLSSDEGGWLTQKVALEAHIMSKCPDAKDCLHDLILPTMQKVHDKVDFTLSYIGNSTDQNDGVECKHGQSECLGNIIELCAAKLYPDPKIYLGYTMCLTNQYHDIPSRELIEECALEHGIDMEKLNACTVDDDGALSVDMLQSSFNRSASAGVTKSCTVRLAGEIRCIRDDGEWKDCEGGSKVKELVRDIEHLYSSF